MMPFGIIKQQVKKSKYLAEWKNYLTILVPYYPQEVPMEKFIIEGGIPLKGEITPSGNKNAALPILAATLLTNEPVILHNVPSIRDVVSMRKLIASLGVKVEDLGGNSWRIAARSVRPADL